MKSKRHLAVIIFLATILFCSGLLSNAQTASTTQSKQPIEIGDTLEIVRLRGLVEANPSDIEAHLAYTKAYRKYTRAIGITGQTYEGLERQYVAWMEKYPKIAAIPFGIGSAFEGAESPKAKPWLLKTLAIDPKFAPAYMSLWGDADRWGDFESGRKYIRMAAEADPTNPDYAFYYANTFDEIDFEKYRQLSLDVAGRFSTHDRGAQALYWLAVHSKSEKDKIAVWEQLRTKFPPEKFGWSSFGMSSYFDYLLTVSPSKALELAQSMNKLKSDGNENNAWAKQIQLAENMVMITKLIAEKKHVEALKVLNDIKLSKYSSLNEPLTILKSKTIDATGNTRAAYDSIATYYAKNPSDIIGEIVKQFGAKLGKSTADIKNDISEIRNASAQSATTFTLGQYFRLGTASLSDFKGKVVLITYWFPGCGPCRAEFPYFESVVKKFKDKDFAYLGLNIAPEQDDYVLPFLKNSGYSFIPLRDFKGREKGNLNNKGLAPINFLLDKDGKIIFSHFRIDKSNEKTLELMIGELLNSKPI